MKSEKWSLREVKSEKCKVKSAARGLKQRWGKKRSAVRWLMQRAALGFAVPCVGHRSVLQWGCDFSSLFGVHACLRRFALPACFHLERRWAEAGAVGEPGFPAVRGMESGLQEYDGSPVVTDGWVWQGCCRILAWLVFWLGQPGSVNWIGPCGEDEAVAAALYLASAECLSASCLCSWGCAECSFSCSLSSSWCFSLSATVMCICPFFCLVKTITSRLMECLAWS